MARRDISTQRPNTLPQTCLSFVAFPLQSCGGPYIIGRRLNVPVVSKTGEQAKKQFSFLAELVAKHNPTSRKLTQERLGWKATHSGLVTDLNQADYFEA
jgi:predicted LPLAT superfamily acyltransferase